MPLFSRSKSSKSGVTVEAGATPPSSKATASAPAPASSGAQRLQFSFAPPDAMLCMHLQQNARGSGWEPCLNGSAVDAAWFETDWLPNLQAAHAAAVLFSDKYRAEFSVALAREARALLTRRQRDPAFKLYVVTANNDKETAVITGWLLRGEASKNVEPWEAFVAEWEAQHAGEGRKPSTSMGAAPPRGVTKASMGEVSESGEMVGRGTGEFVDAFGNPFNYEGDLSLYSKTPRGGALDGKPHGEGTASYLDGQKYVGQWFNGMMRGKGTYTWPDGGSYVGEWLDDRRHGQGTREWPDGRRHVGEYVRDQRHGQGTSTWPSGQQYVGEYEHDRPHGRGTHTWPSGQKYEGEWAGGLENGMGKLTLADGTVHEGTWQRPLDTTPAALVQEAAHALAGPVPTDGRPDPVATGDALERAGTGSSGTSGPPSTQHGSDGAGASSSEHAHSSSEDEQPAPAPRLVFTMRASKSREAGLDASAPSEAGPSEAAAAPEPTPQAAAPAAPAAPVTSPVELREIEEGEDGEKAEHCWAGLSGEEWSVRGATYLNDRKKYPSQTASQLLAIEIFHTPTPVADASARPGAPTAALAARCAKEVDRLFVCNLMMPLGNVTMQVVFYFGLFAPLPPHFKTLLDRYLAADDAFRNLRFKLIAKVVDGPWYVRRAVPQKPAVLGKTVPLRFHKGDVPGLPNGYFAVDVDTTNSRAANRVLSVVTPYTKSLVVDIAFVLEGQEDLVENEPGAYAAGARPEAGAATTADCYASGELPEIVMGSGRFCHVELTTKAIPELDS